MEWISSRSSSAPEGPEPVESSRQIIDQILACLKTRMDADQAAFLQRRATTLRRGPGGNNQTFKPAPAGTELKQPELIEESRMFVRCHIVKKDTEQTRCPVKISPQDRLSRIRSDAGIKNNTHSGLLFDKVTEFHNISPIGSRAHLQAR